MIASAWEKGEGPVGRLAHATLGQDGSRKAETTEHDEHGQLVPKRQARARGVRPVAALAGAMARGAPTRARFL
jgi:hypothetical protein